MKGYGSSTTRAASRGCGRSAASRSGGSSKRGSRRVALHGHIHEGRGRYKLGRTVGINPGSQYQDGVLMGVLVRVSPTSGVRDVTFTAG